MTLDEFALWMDLSDDYWDAAGRKSIDAAVIFGGLTNIVAILSARSTRTTTLPAWLKKIGTLRHQAPPGGPPRAAAASAPENAPAPATAQ